MSLETLLAYFQTHNPKPGSSKHYLQYSDLGALGRFGDLQLSSVFQPIYRSDGGEPVAFEALLRATDGSGAPLSPLEAFQVPEGAREILYFDRLCRVVHVINFMLQSPAERLKLFINVDARHLTNVSTGTHGTEFESLLLQAGLPQHRVVLEMLESGIDDFALLDGALKAYKQRGFLVAIDDFGARASNFDRLWRLQPDIVKLDRELLLQAQTNSRAKRILPTLVAILHDLEATVVCEGIETLEQWLIARDAGVDMVQGYLFGRPQTLLSNENIPPELSGRTAENLPARPSQNLRSAA